MSLEMTSTAHHAWVKLLEAILACGNLVAPQGKPTKELIGMNLLISDAYANIIYHPTRKLNYRFMVAQWLTTLLGSEDRPLLDRFNSQLGNYDGDGRGGRYPSYGPKLKSQWMFIMKGIREDPETRQAVMSIWEPPIMRELPPTDGVAGGGAAMTRDVPCTLSLQFLLRDRHLHTIATMRSSDAWLGLPYDIFNFTMLANHLAAALSQVQRERIRLGSITFNLGSSHLYEENWEQAQKVVVHASVGIGKTVISPPLPSSFDLPPLLPYLKGCDPAHALSLPAPWFEYAHALLATTSDEALKYLERLEDTYAHVR